jgi:hypothetical protein
MMMMMMMMMMMTMMMILHLDDEVPLVGQEEAEQWRHHGRLARAHDHFPSR